MRILNKRLISISSIFLIGASILGYGTKAWFTSQARSSGNTFNAGTLQVQIVDNDIWKQYDKNLVYKSFILEPGMIKSVPILIKNTGSLDSSYRLRPYVKNENKINNRCITDVLRVKAISSSNVVLFDGLLKDLNSGSINKNLDRVNGFLRGQGTDSMGFEFYIPQELGNDYKSLSAEIGFYVDAVQYNRPKVDGILSSMEYSYAKLDQVDTSSTNSYIYAVDDSQYLYIFMKGYPTGNLAALTINELNTPGNTHKIIATADKDYKCSLKYEDGSTVEEAVAIVKAAEDPKFPKSGQVCFEFRIAKSALSETDHRVTISANTVYGKASIVKVTENKLYIFKK